MKKSFINATAARAAALVLVLTSAAILPANAATAPGTVAVSANVATNCTLGASTMPFGTYDPLVANFAANLDVSGSLLIACTKGTPATLTLDVGANSTHAVGTTRAMVAGGSNYLSYELYTLTGRTTVWNTVNSVAYNSVGKAQQTVSIFGRVPGGQDASSGAYADTVNATATF